MIMISLCTNVIQNSTMIEFDTRTNDGLTHKVGIIILMQFVHLI